MKFKKKKLPSPTSKGSSGFLVMIPGSIIMQIRNKITVPKNENNMMRT